MTQDEIIEMAKQAGILHESDTAEIISECGVEVWLSPSDGVNTLERFAKLVAQHEREACANACEEAKTNDWEGSLVCAAVIRARRQA